MRVLILSNMYPRDSYPAGGIFIHEQVEALRKRGVDARVLTGAPFWVHPVKPRPLWNELESYRSSVPEWTSRDTVPVMYFPYLVGGLFKPSIHALTYVYGLRRVLPRVRREFPFDIVHAHTSFLDGTAGITAARKQNVPVVITEHTGPFTVLTRNRFIREVTLRAVKSADRVFAVSSSLKRDMVSELHVPSERIDVLANGVDLSRFVSGTRGRGDAASHVRALWVGHFVEVKRLDRLVQAFARVADATPKLTLTLLGDGEKKQEIRSMVAELGLSERIDFLPSADRAGVAHAMRDHDFLVVSSETETFSLVTVEALASGTPVLSTACGGPQDIIVNDTIGMVVTNDTEGLATGLEQMSRKVKGFDPAALRKYAHEKYSWESIADALVLNYEQLIKSGRRKAK